MDSRAQMSYINHCEIRLFSINVLRPNQMQTLMKARARLVKSHISESNYESMH